MTLSERCENALQRWRKWQHERNRQRAFNRWFRHHNRASEETAWASIYWNEYQETFK